MLFIYGPAKELLFKDRIPHLICTVEFNDFVTLTV